MSLKKIPIYIFILLFSITLWAQENQINDSKSVLFLFSGSHEFSVNRKMFTVFEQVLEPNNIEIIPEYLGDNNSVFYRDKEVFLDFFKQKYGEHRKFDLIIAVNQKATTLCQEYGKELFPNTKILNLDVLNHKSLLPAMTKQINIIQDLHKDLEYLLVISDGSNRGGVLKKSVKSYIDSVGVLSDKTIYIDFGRITYSEIDRYEYYTKKKSVVLLLSAYQDVSLKKKYYMEQVEFLNKELNLPIYNFHEKDERAQVVGGCFLDVDDMAKKLSGKIMLILNNMPINQVDFRATDIFKLYLNKDMTDKYNLDIQQYKHSVIIQTKKDGSFMKMASQIVSRLLQGVFLFLAIMVILLNNKNRKYKKKIEKCKIVHLAIFNKSLQYILMVDTKSGTIIDCNQKIAQSDFRDNIIKNESKITDFFSPQINEILVQNDIDCSSKIYEIDFNTKKISFPAKVTSFNMLYGDQEIAYIQFLNISENKQEMMKLNKIINEKENIVQESKCLIDNFILEIRDPLNVKRGFEQLLQKEELTNERKNEYENIIRTNSDKLLKLVEKILIYSELDNNTKIFNNQEFSINKNIRNISNSIQNEINEKGKNIKLVNYFSLSEGKDLLFNDKEYFCLVFHELLENAAKFTEKGTIECGYIHPNEGKIIFYIKDTGIGMSVDEQREAFSKFSFPVGQNDKSNSSGIGIGLAICRNLITKMGGNLWLTTNENVGTTVYFYLDYDMSIFKELNTVLHQAEIDIIKQRSILVIDEDLGNQKFIMQILKKYNIGVKTMPNYQFYKNFRETNREYDLILFDYSSGFEEFISDNKVKLLANKTSLIIMTRVILEEKVNQALEGLRYTVISKPIKLQEMIISLIKHSK